MKNFDTESLLTWFNTHKRALPFRLSKDPYAIWVSEIMAQQTQIVTMLPYYQRWMNQFPTIQTLANAEISIVLKHWEGLGYYSRARNLHKAAQLIMDQYHGIFPTTKEEILNLPGIGDYTASAICSIAFGQHEIAVDGNVIRVLSRYQENDADFLKDKEKQKLKQQLLEVSKEVDAGDFTEALMELGALVCTPKNASCQQCPLRDQCSAYAHDSVTMYPLKKEKKKVPTEHYKCYISLKDEALLLDLNPSDSLMKGLSRLPMVDKNDQTYQEKETFLFSVSHVFSHKKWEVDVFQLDHPETLKKEWNYIPLIKAIDLPFIGIHKKIIERLQIFRI